MRLRFVSCNANKITEATTILAPRGITVIPALHKIEELQTTDMTKLVHDKVLQAFEKFRRPLFVEHTSLYIDAAGGLPGGLTQIFWDSLEADRFARMFGRLASPTKAVVQCSIAYCDGKKIIDFTDEIHGEIPEVPRGTRDFKWDCVFQPDGGTSTYAEMKAQKNDVSMRRVVLDRFADFLAKSGARD
jgi:XTP/dITP diphosphohydrolase